MPVEFRRQVLTLEYLDPGQDFQRRSFTLEVRTDPLTKKKGTVFQSPSLFAARRYAADTNAVAALVEKSLELGCPFCPGVVEKAAPRFTPEFWFEGLIRKGEALVFPNRDLFHAPFTAILILGQQHHLDLPGFTPQLLANGLEAAQVYFRRVADFQPASRYHTVNWNYFPPAGGSIVHSHLQLLGSPVPFNRHAELLEASRRYRRRHRSNFWADLIAAERERGERYIGRTGRVSWLSPFIPRGRLWDVMAVFDGGGSLTELSPQDLRDLAEGMIRVLRFIHDQGQYSFNFSLVSGLPGEDSLWTIAHILPRTTTPPMGMSDCSYLDTLLAYPSTAIAPEQVCQELKGRFA